MARASLVLVLVPSILYVGTVKFREVNLTALYVCVQFPAKYYEKFCTTRPNIDKECSIFRIQTLPLKDHFSEK